MPLYLAATPDRLTRARAVTPRLAHVAYRLGPGSELLAAPLPPALRGGLMVLSDWDCPPVEDPDRLARQIARTCLRRGYAGAAADFDPPARPDRAALLQALLHTLHQCYAALPPVALSGRYDAQTQAAVAALQRMAGLQPDGVTGKQTWRFLTALYRSATRTAPAPRL